MPRISFLLQFASFLNGSRSDAEVEAMTTEEISFGEGGGQRVT